MDESRRKETLDFSRYPGTTQHSKNEVDFYELKF